MKKGDVVNVFQDGKFYRGKKGEIVEVDSKRFKVVVPEIGWLDGEWFKRVDKSESYTCEDGWNEWIFKGSNPKNFTVIDGSDYEKFITSEELVVFDEDDGQTSARKW